MAQDILSRTNATFPTCSEQVCRHVIPRLVACATLRFNVDDIGAAAEALAKKGVAFRRRDNPWGHTLDFTDPEGNACQIRDEASFGP